MISGAGSELIGRPRSVTGLYCLVAIAFWYWTPGAAYIASLVADRWAYGGNLAWYLYGDALLAAFVLGAVLIGRPSPREIFGRAPQRRDVLPIALTVAITWCASGAFITLTMVPASYVLPSFVEWWLNWSYPFTFYLHLDGSIPILPNVLRVADLVVITPILEDTIFRGYLLNAWARKWGLFMGLLLSSAVFGAIHPDTIPAMLTGVGFALLYLRTQSLWTPILAHGTYNAMVSVWNVWEIARNGWQYVLPTLEGLRSEWWLGVIELLVVAVLIDRIMRRGALAPLRLPRSSAGAN